MSLLQFNYNNCLNDKNINQYKELIHKIDKNSFIRTLFFIVGKPGKTQTYWLQSETKEGAIRKKPPDASTQLKPLCLSKNIGGIKTLLYHLSLSNKILKGGNNQLSILCVALFFLKTNQIG